MQVQIINGIYADTLGDYRTEYPRNMVPIPKQQGISNGYLRPSEGIDLFTETDGIDRDGINWNGVLYRVLGSKLCRIDENGAVVVVGDVGLAQENVSFAYSFDYLAVASAGSIYLYDGTSAVQRITDVDLGNVLDVLWLDGYFVTADGEFLVTTDLTNPFNVNPFRYGSSEIDPDPIVGLQKLNNEIAALNRYTVEFFDNVGGGANQFPFQRIDGAQLDRGCICLLYTSPSPRDKRQSRMPSSA